LNSIGVQVSEGPKGLRWLKAGGLFVHGPGEPLAQAREWISAQVGQEAGVVAVLGLGLGYHLAALRQKRPQAQIIVWEPLAQVAELFRKQGLAGLLNQDQITVVDSLEALKSGLAQTYVYGPAWLQLGTLIPEAYNRLVPQAVSDFKQASTQLILRRESNLRTIVRRQAEFQSNLAQNFGHLLDLAEATAAQNSLAEMPAVIVAAGPSLAKNIHVLKQNQDRLTVISVGTVFKRLVEEGIIPGVVVMIEGQDRSDQVADQAALKSVIVAASSFSHPAHLSQKPLRTLVFHPSPWVSRLVGDWPPVPDGGNVASAAFTLALLWGCNPIILVGQDLAYSQGRLYAQGAASPDRNFDPDRLLSLPGNAEPRVFASGELVSYLSWYEESALYLAQVRPDLKLINATEGGARIQGFSHCPLIEAVPGPDQPVVRGRDRLLKALAGFRRDPDLIRRRLAEFRHETARLAGLAGQESTDLEALMRELTTSSLAPALKHLIGPAPNKDRLRKKIRTEIEQNLAALSDLAARLQKEARSWAFG